MLSSESLLFALNSGCLNSQACAGRGQQIWAKPEAGTTHIRPVWRLPGFLIVLANFVEIVLVELANKTGKIAVLEVLGQDGFCEFLALQGKRRHDQ